VKELLVNVVKHAKATTVKVVLTKKQNNITISVEDDGVGFLVNDNSNNKKASFGLFHLRNRIDHLGGCLDVNSKPGNGTKVAIVMPLEQENSLREDVDQ